MYSLRILLASVLVAWFANLTVAQGKTPLTLIVMDPMAAPLSCDCVKGYAQRDYTRLAKYLEMQLDRPVKLYFNESLTNALQKKTDGRADLIIGKESVIRHQAKESNLGVMPIASLTGKDGKTTMTGLFVLPADDKAVTLADIKGHRILFGPANADEKHVAAFELMKVFELSPPKKLETCNSCSEGALKVLDLHKKGIRAATVISSYAEPLLEGCGTIKKGDLRVIGETDPTPFVVAFVNERLASSDRAEIKSALIGVGKSANLCAALETKNGFVPFQVGKKK